MKKPITEKLAQPHAEETGQPLDNAANEGGTSPVEASEIDALREDLKKFQDLALRSAADLENYRKRMIREKEESLRYANASLIERLLPVVDSFELGLDAARSARDAEAIVRGFELVEKQLQDFLKESGTEEIDAAGQDFDPKSHEAVTLQPDPSVPEGRVLHQIRKGYRLRERLLRPASVVVSKGPSEA